jgi:hypothetical protein
MKISEIRGGINMNTTIYKNIGDLGWCIIIILRLTMSAVLGIIDVHSFFELDLLPR